MVRNDHVVWDWNGTLLDDFAITARITIDALADLGRPGVTEADIRAHYRRPLVDYFAALLGRAALPHELAHLAGAYDRRYEAVMRDQPLAVDALAALGRLAPHATQSLLSMAPHAQVALLIAHHRLDGHFSLVQGFAGDGQPSKRASLAAHCAALGRPPERCWLVGDTVDDFVAAAALGMRPVLVSTGMQSAAGLAATGAPVVPSLADAVDLILTA